MKDHATRADRLAKLIHVIQLCVSDEMDKSLKATTAMERNYWALEAEGSLTRLGQLQRQWADEVLASIEFPDIAVTYPRWMVAGGDAR